MADSENARTLPGVTAGGPLAALLAAEEVLSVAASYRVPEQAATPVPEVENPERLSTLLASLTTALANLDASVLAATVLAAAVRRELAPQDRRATL